MTPKQASRALAALDNAVWRVRLYAETAHVDDQTTAWEREAIFRLRGHLIAMLPDGDPQLEPRNEAEVVA